MTKMDHPKQKRNWATTCAHLGAARRELPESPVAGAQGATVASYENFLEHNELELALDELADMGLTNAPGAKFWLHLKRAAENMGLSERTTALERELRKQ